MVSCLRLLFQYFPLVLKYLECFITVYYTANCLSEELIYANELRNSRTCTLFISFVSPLLAFPCQFTSYFHIYARIEKVVFISTNSDFQILKLYK